MPPRKELADKWEDSLDKEEEIRERKEVKGKEKAKGKREKKGFDDLKELLGEGAVPSVDDETKEGEIKTREVKERDLEALEMEAESEVIEKEDEKESVQKVEKLGYLVNKLVVDLENVYGEDDSLRSYAGARMKENGVKILYTDDLDMGLHINYEAGLDLASLIREYFAMESGAPEDWEKGLSFIEKSGISVKDLEEARRKKGELFKKEEKEKRVKDERYIWYQGIEKDLTSATEQPPIVKKDTSPEKRLKIEQEIVAFSERKSAAVENLQKRIPSIDQILRDDRGQLYWASRILDEGGIYDKQGKQINPWSSKELALAYLRDNFNIDRTGVDPLSMEGDQVKDKEEVLEVKEELVEAPKTVETEDQKTVIENLLVRLSGINGYDAAQEDVLESLEGRGIKIRKFLVDMENLSPGKQNEVLMQLRAVVEIWRMDEEKRSQYPKMMKIAEVYSRILGVE